MFCNVPKSLRLPRKMQFEPPKTSWAPSVLMVLTSKSLSLARAWCKFYGAQLQKALRTHCALTILTSKSLSHHIVAQILRSWTSKSAPTPSVFNDFDFQIALSHSVGQIFSTSWAADPPHHLAFRSWLCESSRPKSLMSHIYAVKYLCRRTSMLKTWRHFSFSIVGS